MNGNGKNEKITRASELIDRYGGLRTYEDYEAVLADLTNIWNDFQPSNPAEVTDLSRIIRSIPGITMLKVNARQAGRVGRVSRYGGRITFEGREDDEKVKWWVLGRFSVLAEGECLTNNAKHRAIVAFDPYFEKGTCSSCGKETLLQVRDEHGKFEAPRDRQTPMDCHHCQKEAMEARKRSNASRKANATMRHDRVVALLDEVFANVDLGNYEVFRYDDGFAVVKKGEKMKRHFIIELYEHVHSNHGGNYCWEEDDLKEVGA